MAKRIILALLLLTAAVCLVGCQTVGGLGRDLQWTGDSIQKTVD